MSLKTILIPSVWEISQFFLITLSQHTIKMMRTMHTHLPWVWGHCRNSSSALLIWEDSCRTQLVNIIEKSCCFPWEIICFFWLLEASVKFQSLIDGFNSHDLRLLWSPYFASTHVTAIGVKQFSDSFYWNWVVMKIVCVMKIHIRSRWNIGISSFCYCCFLAQLFIFPSTLPHSDPSSEWLLYFCFSFFSVSVYYHVSMIYWVT